MDRNESEEVRCKYEVLYVTFFDEVVEYLVALVIMECDWSSLPKRNCLETNQHRAHHLNVVE